MITEISFKDKFECMAGKAIMLISIKVGIYLPGEDHKVWLQKRNLNVSVKAILLITINTNHNSDN